jgi:hypothetical protein
MTCVLAFDAGRPGPIGGAGVIKKRPGGSSIIGI